MTTGTQDVAAIGAAALQARCGFCWAEPGDDCPGGEGLHLARVARSYRRGLITEADMRAVLDAVTAAYGDVFTEGTIVPGTDPARIREVL